MAALTVVYIAFLTIVIGNAAIVVPLAILGLLIGGALGYRARRRL